MIKFKDFVTKVLDYGGIMSFPEFEPTEETLMRINLWIEENEIVVLNIETIMMPELNKARSSLSTSGFFIIEGCSSSKWFQIYRVWYNE